MLEQAPCARRPHGLFRTSPSKLSLFGVKRHFSERNGQVTALISLFKIANTDKLGKDPTELQFNYGIRNTWYSSFEFKFWRSLSEDSFFYGASTILFLRFVHYISGVLYVKYGLQVWAQFAYMLYIIEIVDMMKNYTVSMIWEVFFKEFDPGSG